MRTLKKTLSLVLVVAMVLGLCVVGASAKDKVESFTDDYQKVGAAYQEAVGVLVGVGIIDGMTETALEPQGTYTREQAAKIIAYMLLGKSKADSLGCTVAPFDDVAASRWSAGYIAFCVEQGIIDGMTATTYEPTGTLTGFQWAKMLLCAIGFGVKGEFTGSSWSVNTALVAHKVNLFAGDLDGADHTALRREQAALYAFNALNTLKVAYSPNVTSYVFGIKGYETVNGIGSTLAKDVYDLKCATGIVVDVEGNGAGYTVLSKDYSTANVTDKIKADNDIDMMYHAANVWYTGTNTGVYTYDLAKTTTYKCQEITAGSKAADTAKAKTGLYVGEKPNTTATMPVAYEAYLIDNSAISAGSAYVTLYAALGSMGYVDAAKKTTSVVCNTIPYTAPTANVRTDVSNIKYGAPVVFVYTTSTTENNAHGMYVYPMTSTTGVVKSIAQDSGKVVSVTLTDGTVLNRSVLANNAGDREYYVIGNTYTFVLDSHGHVMYATKDHARTLWAYTEEYKMTNDYGAIDSDYVKAYRFINVTTGEEAFYPAKFINANSVTNDPATSGAQPEIKPQYGQYFDISATPGSDGRYVAELINTYENTYAAGYVVANATFTAGVDNTYTTQVDDHYIYFDSNNVTFLVATGTGSKMEVKSYTGIAALKQALGVASNGTVTFNRAAFTVTQTKTGHWNASTIFVMAANVKTTSSYAFIPANIAKTDWDSISGYPDGYSIVYGGAYIDGEKYDIVFSEEQVNNGRVPLTRGFYEVSVAYDRNGRPTVELTQKKDNTGECFYSGVEFVETQVNNVWRFKVGATYYSANDTATKIVDLTSYGIKTLEQLWWNVENNAAIDLAFTVNKATKVVDYVYVTAAGWDAQYNISLSADMIAAGWVFKDGDKTSTSFTLNDDAAWAVSNKKQVSVTLYNAKFAKNSTDYTFNLGYYESADKSALTATTSNMTKGVVTATLTLNKITPTVKTWNYVVNALNNNEAITFSLGTNSRGDDLSNYYKIESVKVPAGYTSTTDSGKFIFGTPVVVTLSTKFGADKSYIEFIFDNEFNANADIKVVSAVKVTDEYQYITLTVYPMCSGDYKLISAEYCVAPAT